MSKSSFSFKKLLKLYLQIAFYAVVIYGIFCIAGHESLSPMTLVWKVWPIKSITLGFTSCFLAFYLFIPVLNVLVKSMNQHMHKYLVIILLTIFSVLPTYPRISMTHNYVMWFMSLYMIASYIRLYGLFPKIPHGQWGLLAFASVMLGSASVLFMYILYIKGYIGTFAPYIFVADSNKILSVVIAVCSFMYFKDMKIPQSRLINALGASTFGVFLIHANSDAMRQWLWRDTVDCIGHFGDSVLWTFGYASVTVLMIFIVCAGIDWFRAKYIEPIVLDPIYIKSKLILNRLQTA